MGDFTAYVQGNGKEMNWRTALASVFSKPGDGPRTRDHRVWAILSRAESIDGSATADGLPSTRLSLMSPAQAVYVQLPLEVWSLMLVYSIQSSQTLFSMYSLRILRDCLR